MDLKKLREERGLTQTELASLTGLSQQVISKIETYDYNPNIDTAKKLASFLGIDWTEFFKD